MRGKIQLGYMECQKLKEEQMIEDISYRTIKIIGWLSVIFASFYSIWYVTEQIQILRLAGYIQ